MPHKAAEQHNFFFFKWLLHLYDQLKNHYLYFFKFLYEQTAMPTVNIKYVEIIFSIVLTFTYI